MLENALYLVLCLQKFLLCLPRDLKSHEATVLGAEIVRWREGLI